MTATALSPPHRTRRRITWRGFVRFLVVVLIVHLAGLVAASWYYSNRIQSDALAVRPGSQQHPFTVSAVDSRAGAITLRRIPDDPAGDWQRRDLLTPMVQGLYWKDGSTYLARGATRAVDDTLVVTPGRSWGRPPVVGDTVGAHTFTYPRGMVDPWQPMTYAGPSGQLPAAFSPGVGPDGPRAAGAAAPWVVMVHGKGASTDEFTRMVGAINASGFSAMSIEYRGDPGASAAPDGRYGFGATEWPDLEAAVGHAVTHGATEVVLMGASMGGAIVASYLRHAKDTSAIRAVILDAPALSLARTVQWGADQIALPGGIPLPAPITWGALKLSTLRFGVDWEATDYVTDPSWDTLPTLLFHGDQDLTVPVATSREFAAGRSNVVYVEVKGAGHVASWNADPSGYDRAVKDFLDRTHPKG